MESVGAPELLRGLSTLALLWLAAVFGLSLRRSRVPLIERIARVREPALPPAQVRYTRRLTQVWCVYLGFAAVSGWWLSWTPLLGGVIVTAVSLLLFVGEHRLRRVWFPGQQFPSLVEQVRDTAAVMRRPEH